MFAAGKSPSACRLVTTACFGLFRLPGCLRSLPRPRSFHLPTIRRAQEHKVHPSCFQGLARSFPRSLRSCALVRLLTRLLSGAHALFGKTTREGVGGRHFSALNPLLSVG